MQSVGTVRALFRYPVKSTAGQGLQLAELDARGLVDDRSWAVYTADGGIVSGKTTRRFRRVDGLMSWRSTTPADSAAGHPPWLHSPDGVRYRVDDPAAAAALTAAFRQPLTPRPETTVPHYDECGVHLVTTSALRRAAQLAGGRIDGRRLRPNIVLDTDGVDFLEDGWQGAELAIGSEVVLRVGSGMPRCAMVDQPQDGLLAGPPLLRALGREHHLLLGAQTEVVTIGIIRTGEQVRLVSR
jgi:uncharacterized protein YcbX